MDSGHDIKPRLAEAVSRLTSKEIPCIFCKKLWESRLTIINDKREIIGALEALGVKYESIPGVTDYACYKCVYRINVIIDFRRLLERNINKTRANYYYAIGNKDLCQKYLLSTGNGNFSNSANETSSNDHINLIITDVRSEREPERTADFLFDCFNDPDLYSSQYTQQRNDDAPNSPSQLLKPMYETEYSESAALMSKYKNYNNLMARKSLYKCQFCTKTYKRLHYLRKHERKHRGTQRGKQNKRMNAESVVGGQYECERCHETFDNRVLLKSHTLSHRNRIKCSYCTAEFYLKHDLDLHEAKCFGEISARDETISIRTHYVRSGRKKTNYVENDDSNDGEVDTFYDERLKDIDNWVERVEANYDWDSATFYSGPDDDAASIHSFVSNFSRASSVMTATTCAESTLSFASSARVEEHVSYERPKFNRKAFERNADLLSESGKTRSSIQLSERLKRLDSCVVGANLSEKEYNTQDWQRLRKLMKRKNKVSANLGQETKATFYCQEPKCYYFDFSVQKIMEHDMQVHHQLPLYYCKECQSRFTRMDYLQYHLMDHPAKHHPCHLCNDRFDYLHELRYHLELHAIRSHQCPTCSKSFLKVAQLTSHMLESSHFESTSKNKTEFCRLFDEEREPNENPRLSQTVGSENEAAFKHKTYLVHYTPQPEDPLGKRSKFELVSWKLGDITNYQGGIAPSALEIDISLNAEQNTDEIPVEDDEPSAKIISKSPEPAASSSPRADIIDMEPDTADTLQEFDLFSTDNVVMEDLEPEAETRNDDQEEDGNSESNMSQGSASRKKRKRSFRIRSLKIPISLPLIIESPLPSYSDLFNPKFKHKRIRLLPYLNCAYPARLPC